MSQQMRIDAPIPCFWLEDLHVTRYALRRYGGGECGMGMYSSHEAMGAHIADVADDPEHPGICGTRMPSVPDDDPAWPKSCACGHVFGPRDVRQVFPKRLLRRPDTGETLTWEEAAPGAMMDASWWPNKGPDGLVLMVKLPCGTDWMVDGPSSGGDRTPWARSGDPRAKPPTVTAMPSILTSRWHGWLREGKLWQA